MDPEQVSKARSLLSKPEEVVIVTHRSPDGDAIGSSLGLYNFLLKKGHKVSVIVPNEFPDFLKWMPGADKILVFEKEEKRSKELVSNAEIIFCLDFNTLKRIDKLGDEVRKANSVKFLIDHHEMPEDFADYKFHFTDACSTAQLIFEFIELTGDKSLIDEQSGICIYTGIMTDTASFRFPSVTAQTHRIAAELIGMGVPHWMAHEKVYDSNSADRLKLLGYALGEKLNILKEFHTVYITLSKEELERMNHRAGDTEGIVNYCLSIEGVRFAAFFMHREGTIKLSFRSKGKFDVNAFARAHFNGGGHKNAAGGNIDNVSMEQAVNYFRDLLPKYSDLLNKD